MRHANIAPLLMLVFATSCGRTVDEPTPPPRDAAPSASTVRIYAAGSWSCSLDQRGEVTCWGAFTDGTRVPPDESFGALALGSVAACGLRTGETLRCWPGAPALNGSPVPPGRFANVSVGATHACGIRSTDRQVICWGGSDFGAIDAPHGRFIDAAAGNLFSCALHESGQPVCWGRNDQGQASPPGGTFVRVVAGHTHACALDADGVVSCWGESTGAHGQRATAVTSQVGTCIIRPDETVACFGVSEQMVDIPKGPVKGLAIGIAHGCVVRKDDRIECWGSDSLGQASPPR